jgi:hypothetical protein
MVASLLFTAQVFAAAARLEPLTIGYSNFTGTYGPLWIAVEERGMLCNACAIGLNGEKQQPAAALSFIRRDLKRVGNSFLPSMVQDSTQDFRLVPFCSLSRLS